MLSTIIILTIPPRDLFKKTTSKPRGRQEKFESKPNEYTASGFLPILITLQHVQRCFKGILLPIFSLPHLGHVRSVTEVQFFIWNTWYVIHSLDLV